MSTANSVQSGASYAMLKQPKALLKKKKLKIKNN